MKSLMLLNGDIFSPVSPFKRPELFKHLDLCNLQWWRVWYDLFDKVRHPSLVNNVGLAESGKQSEGKFQSCNE